MKHALYTVYTSLLNSCALVMHIRKKNLEEKKLRKGTPGL